MVWTLRVTLLYLLEAGVADGVGDLLALLLGQLPGDGAGHAAAALGHHGAAPGRGRHLPLQNRGRGLGSRVTRIRGTIAVYMVAEVSRGHCVGTQ